MTRSPRETAVLEHVGATKDEQVELLQELIRARPVNPPGGEAAAATLLRPRLEALGFEVTEYEKEPGRPNLVARLPGDGSGPTLLTTAHLDVVPVGDRDAWPCEPFDGELRDGRVYGRGACDHKSPIVAMLAAVEALQAADVDLGGELVFVFDADEERGGEYGMRHVVENVDIDPDMGIYAVTSSLQPDAAEYFPNTGRDNVFRANYGNQVFRVEIEGHLEHPLAPAETDGAGARLARLLPALQEYCDSVKRRTVPVVGRPDAEVTTFDSDGRPGRASPRVDAHVHRYYGPSEDPDEVLAEFEAHVERAAAAADLDDAVSVSRIKHMPNVAVDEDHPLVEAAVHASQRVRGRSPAVSGIPAQTGITWLVRQFEMPMILFGYGNANLHHGDPEWVEVEDVVDMGKAYALTYMELLDAAPADG